MKLKLQLRNGLELATVDVSVRTHRASPVIGRRASGDCPDINVNRFEQGSTVDDLKDAIHAASKKRQARSSDTPHRPALIGSGLTSNGSPCTQGKLRKEYYPSRQVLISPSVRAARAPSSRASRGRISFCGPACAGRAQRPCTLPDVYFAAPVPVAEAHPPS